MTATDLVRFGASFEHKEVREVPALPRDTCDPRFAACTDHHLACDCREAMFAEDKAEDRAILAAVQQAAGRVLVGHEMGTCMCTGCVIVRKSHLHWFSPSLRTPSDPIPKADAS